jgi:hypothetical protein
MLCLLSVTRVLLRVNVLLSSSVYCPSLFFDYLFNINVCTVKACRLETKVLNYVHEEDIMKCNIITGTSVSVCKFRTSPAGMFVSVLPLLWQYRTRTVVFEVDVNWVRTPRILLKLILCWSFI